MAIYFYLSPVKLSNKWCLEHETKLGPLVFLTKQEMKEYLKLINKKKTKKGKNSKFIVDP